MNGDAVPASSSSSSSWDCMVQCDNRSVVAHVCGP